MYHVNKSQLLKIFDPTPYLTSTLKKDALILDFSEIVNYQVAVTTAHFLTCQRVLGGVCGARVKTSLELSLN